MENQGPPKKQGKTIKIQTCFLTCSLKILAGFLQNHVANMILTLALIPPKKSGDEATSYALMA